MKYKITGLFRKAVNKLFRKLFDSAYPDAAKLLSEIHYEKDDNGCAHFGKDACFFTESYISAKGINPQITTKL